jgi:signal transduction histidine kinase
LILADLENNTAHSADYADNMEELNIEPLVNEAISSFELQARKKQIDIILKCEKELKAKLYRSLIIQALINLIDNGIKYSHAKSKLWVNVSSSNDEIIFEVRDKGIGIPAKHLERIFERFYRVDRSNSASVKNRETSSEEEQSKGTGLGLSIVRHIALLHGGNVEVESHAGEGSIFRIKIPSA